MRFDVVYHRIPNNGDNTSLWFIRLVVIAIATAVVDVDFVVVVTC